MRGTTDQNILTWWEGCFQALLKALYAFALNDPINYWDPWGLKNKSVAKKLVNDDGFKEKVGRYISDATRSKDDAVISQDYLASIHDHIKNKYKVNIDHLFEFQKLNLNIYIIENDKNYQQYRNLYLNVNVNVVNGMGKFSERSSESHVGTYIHELAHAFTRRMMKRSRFDEIVKYYQTRTLLSNGNMLGITESERYAHELVAEYADRLMSIHIQIVHRLDSIEALIDSGGDVNNDYVRYYIDNLKSDIFKMNSRVLDNIGYTKAFYSNRYFGNKELRSKFTYIERVKKPLAA